ncbi:MAG TPA: DKNYY domain-containing protein [Candidatus Absconditabacterales bacterium]|nr:DKNYY domain-containing protein [Candidatus Absconditabacterales bacterium]
MTNNYSKNEARLDRLLLIFRRTFLILFILFMLRILLFKVLKINKNVNKNSIKETTNNIVNEIKNGKEDKEKQDITKGKTLGNNYSIDKNTVFYKGKEIEFADAKTFKPIIKNDLTGRSLINSNNLLGIFADYNTRVMLMKNIDYILANQENVSLELKSSSENGMFKIKNDYESLSKYDRGDRYNMTSEQRAKFAIMFLYIKIVKKYSNNQATMEKALTELKIFLENFDENDLKKEIDDKELNRIKGDLGVDDDCLYVNGELHACFLDDLFVK